jgi:hypothetical protein
VGLEIRDEQQVGDDLPAALEELKRHGHRLARDDLQPREPSDRRLSCSTS